MTENCYAPVLISVASTLALAITVEELRLQARLDADDSDPWADLAIRAATDYVEHITGRRLITQSWRQDFDTFDFYLRLPFAPVSAVASNGVTYLDANGATQTVGATNYQVLEDERGPYVKFNSAYAFPVTRIDGPAVSVTFSTGYGAAATAVPAALKQALLLLVAFWHENRETVNVGNITTELDFTVNALTATYRRRRFG
jgi:uncharacterized phiE125 gp8 family phage protein